MPRSEQDRLLELQQRQDRLPEESEKLYPNLSRVLGKDFARRTQDELYKKAYANVTEGQQLTSFETDSVVPSAFVKDEYAPKDTLDFLSKYAAAKGIKANVEPSSGMMQLNLLGISNANKKGKDDPYTVGEAPLSRSLGGITYPEHKTVAINSNLSQDTQYGSALHELGGHVMDQQNDPAFDSKPSATSPNHRLTNIIRANSDQFEDSGLFNKYPNLASGNRNVLDMLGLNLSPQLYRKFAEEGQWDRDFGWSVDRLPEERQQEVRKDLMDAIVQKKLYKDFYQSMKHGHNKDYSDFELEHPVVEAKKKLKSLGFDVE